jgi:hypothetical protein
MSKEKYLWDVEGVEEDSEISEVDPTILWETKQRDLITGVVDYSLSALVDLIKDRSIDLSPEYQRRFRWDDLKQSKLIESFLMNVPVPPIFLNEDDYGEYSVIDGKQRMKAISEFFQGKLHLKGLTVFKEINGKTFDELPLQLQTVLETRPTIRAVIILQESDKDIKYVVFQRLNTGGVQLNPQEIRNSTFPGPLSDLVLELSVYKKFHALLGIKNKEKSAIYKEMWDAEFVLRYLAFRDGWGAFSGSVKQQLDSYMDQNAKMSSEQLAEAKNDFLSTLNVVEACFGNYAFRRWVPERNLWRQQVLASLYDAEMFACRGLSVESVYQKQDEIISNLKDLFQDKEFRKAIDVSTNTPVYFRTRIEKLKRMLQRVMKCEW